MPIERNEEYVLKVKTDNGSRIVGNVSMGDYGPRVSIVNAPVFTDALNKVEMGKRIYLPMYVAGDKPAADTVGGSDE